MNRMLRFNNLLLLIGLMVILWLICWPLAMNAWASTHWKEIPCHINEDGQSYIYHIEPFKYGSNRRDFWQLGARRNVPFRDMQMIAVNGTCWVNPSDPNDAVRSLDAFTNWSGSIGRLFAAGLVLAVVLGMNFIDIRRHPANKEGKP